MKWSSRPGHDQGAVFFVFLFTVFLILCSTKGSCFSSSGEVLHLTGFLRTRSYQLFSSDQSTQQEKTSGDYFILDLLSRFKLETKHESFRSLAVFDVEQDLRQQSDSDANLNACEFYGQWRGRHLELTAGKQIIPWGVADGFILTDLINPRDCRQFIIPRLDRKTSNDFLIGVPGCRLKFMSGPFLFESVWITRFVPGKYDEEGIWAFAPPSSGGENPEAETPEPNFGNSEAAARLMVNGPRSQLALCAFYGWDDDASYRFDQKTMQLRPFYSRLRAFGMHFEASVFSSIWRFEAVRRAGDDRNGDDPGIANDSVRALIGWERTLWGTTTVTLQYYTDRMLKYEEYRKTASRNRPLSEKVATTYSLGINSRLFHEYVQPQLISYYNPQAREIFVNGEIQYLLVDHAIVQAGVNLFDTRDQDEGLWKFRRNDHWYLNFYYFF
ncbi:MAG: hypothetical protein AB1847_06365 [bacterium]